MTKGLLVTIAVSILALGLPTQVRATSSILETRIDRVFTAHSDYMEVLETKTTSVISPGYRILKGQLETFVIQGFIKENQEKEQQKLDYMQKSVVVTDVGGNNINFTASRQSDQLIIQVKFPHEIKYGQSYSFTISYKSLDLVQHQGNIYDLYLIPFAKDYQFSNSQDQQIFTTKLRFPTDLGPLNFATPDEPITRIDNYYEINVPTEKLIGKFAWIQLGTKQYYQFELAQPYNSSNNTSLSFNTYEIVIPRDITNSRITQRAYFTSFDPAPEMIRQDDQGNLIAVFSIQSNKTGTIQIKGYAELTQTKDDLSKGGKLQDIPAEMKQFTAPAKYWEVDHPDIVKKAQTLKGSETDIYKLVQTTYNDIVNSIDYANVDRFGISTRKGALATLHGGSAVCMEYSDLFITLMRAQGVPARAAYGHGYDSRVPLNEQVGHQWAEVYFPGLKNWVAVDVTWGESGQTLIGGDLNHLYTHVAISDPESPPQVRAKFFGVDPVAGAIRLNVIPLAGIPTDTTLMTTDQVLNQYPANSQDNFLSGNLRNLGKLISALDADFKNTLSASLHINNRAELQMATIVVYLAPILLAIVYVLVRKHRMKKRQLSAKYRP